ncbi:hypothetical protein L1887_39385 [Cichorium endivia]|nr:hypothetical protein L1887_39385 [Cichorium endivia]
MLVGSLWIGILTIWFFRLLRFQNHPSPTASLYLLRLRLLRHHCYAFVPPHSYVTRKRENEEMGDRCRLTKVGGGCSPILD